MRLWPKFMVFFLAGFILTGCQERSSAGDKVFMDLIRLYDARLSEALARGDMVGIKNIVTAAHGSRLDHRLAGMKKAGRRMESRVLSIEFLEFRDLGDKQLGFPRYRVRTRELWDVRHIDGTTGRLVKEVKGLSYELSYEFEQHDGIWQVDAVEVLMQKRSSGSSEK